MIWMVEKLQTRLCLRESRYNLDVPIQIEIEYQLEGKKVFSSALSKKIRIIAFFWLKKLGAGRRQNSIIS